MRPFALIFTLPLLLAAAGSLRGAELTVPGTHATLAAAVAAAAPGDTITITSSGTFAESLTINKRLTLRAAAGQTPTLAGNGVTGHVIRYTGNCGGSRLGDSAGGRIIINGDAFDTAAAVLRTVWISDVTDPTAHTITFENLSFHSNKINYGPDAGQPLPRDNQMHIFIGAAASPSAPISNLTFRDLSIEGGSNGIWMASSLVNNAGTTMLVERCRINARNFAFITSGAGNIHLLDSHLTNFNASWAVLYYNTSTAGENRIERTRIRPLGNGAAFSSAARREHHTTMIQSVLELPTTGTQNMMVFAGTGFGEHWTIDHCDLIANSPAALFTFGDPSAVASAGNRGLSVSNCNLLNLSSGAGIVASGGIVRDDYLIFRNNNIVTAAQTLFPPNLPPPNNFAVHSIEPGPFELIPAYADPAGGDYTFTLPTPLVRGGEGRTPVGSYFNFATGRLGTPPETPVRGFTAYD